MTLPNERTRSVIQAREFLLALLHKSLWRRAYPGIRWPFARELPPTRFFMLVRALLKHYPAALDLTKARRKDPKTWAEPPKRDIP